MSWSKEEIERLKTHIQLGMSLGQISEEMGKSHDSIRKKIRRNYLNGNFHEESRRDWEQDEINKLHLCLKNKLPYKTISEKLGRTVGSIEKKVQSVDWKIWEIANGKVQTKEDAKGSISPESNLQTQLKTIELEKEAKEKTETLNRLSTALLNYSRHDYKRLREVTEENFSQRINYDFEGEVSFGDILDVAEKELEVMGLKNPEYQKLNKGRYLVVGDSHGKYTRTKMFDLVKMVSQTLKIDNVIHLGHILDDDNDMSYGWSGMDNLIILAKKEELKLIQNQRNKFDFNFKIVIGAIEFGKDLIAMNQDLISDYVKTSIGSLDQEIMDSKTIVNCHRLEFVSKCSDTGHSYYASPGCLCEPHIIKTIKQIDFKDGKTVKQAYHDGFIKYRKMEHLKNLWKQGLLIVNVDEHGDHTIVPCFVHKIEEEYVTSYMDKIITSSGVENPDKKILIMGDTHSPNHDAKTLSIIENICRDYKPDTLVNLGDVHDYRSLNHHDMDSGRVIFGDVLKESAQVYHVLKKMSLWAKETHLITGNHERFAQDFVAKYPQFKSYLDFNFMINAESLGYKLTNLKDVLNINGTKFIHGDMIMFGQSGNKVEKASRTFGEPVFIGHIHSPGIRFGCLSIGCSCNLDQGYNEPNASTWTNGFGLCNHYKEKSFPTTIIIGEKCILNKTYKAKSEEIEEWNVNNYKAKIVYEIE